MPDCIAPLCKNRAAHKRKTKRQLELEKTVHISFHKLPNNENTRKVWIDNLQLDQGKLYKGCRVCSQHFAEEMLDRTSASGHIRLKADAIPYSSKDTVLSRTKEIICNVTDETPPVKRKRTFLENRTDMTEESEPKRRMICNSPLTIKQKSEEITVEQPSTPKRYVDCATSVSPRLSENTLQKVFLRTVLANQKQECRKKIDTLQHAIRCKDKQICEMQEIISKLREKNFMPCEQLQILDDLDTLPTSNIS